MVSNGSGREFKQSSTQEAARAIFQHALERVLPEAALKRAAWIITVRDQDQCEVSDIRPGRACCNFESQSLEIRSGVITLEIIQTCFHIRRESHGEHSIAQGRGTGVRR